MNCRKEKELIVILINKGNLDYNWKLLNENWCVLFLLLSSVVFDNEWLSLDNSWFVWENEFFLVFVVWLIWCILYVVIK